MAGDAHRVAIDSASVDNFSGVSDGGVSGWGAGMVLGVVGRRATRLVVIVVVVLMGACGVSIFKVNAFP